MGVLPSADGSSASAEPVDELTGMVRATGAGAPSLVAQSLPRPAGERR
jgi:hypothetical protein